MVLTRSAPAHLWLQFVPGARSRCRVALEQNRGATAAIRYFGKRAQKMKSKLRSVWSLWTKPVMAGLSNWTSELHHLFGWVLSVETARQHYPQTALYTDDAGARLLVDQVGLQFDYVSTALNALDAHDPN